MILEQLLQTQKMGKFSVELVSFVCILGSQRAETSLYLQRPIMLQSFTLVNRSRAIVLLVFTIL